MASGTYVTRRAIGRRAPPAAARPAVRGRIRSIAKGGKTMAKKGKGGKNVKKPKQDKAKKAAAAK